MDNNFLFILTLSVVLYSLLIWGFKTLPGEKWQFIATLPLHKHNDGGWQGLNLTFYGLFSALAYGIAALIFLILTGSIHAPVSMVMMVLVLILAVCVPASSLLVRIIERKNHGFTVGGASFVGVVITPAAIWSVNLVLGGHYQSHLPMLPLFAAMIIAYSFGEGIGRLGCISFGCCYGKSLNETNKLFKSLFRSWNFTFFGELKKIAYASGLEGKKVIPIQAITAMIYTTTALIGTWFYLQSDYRTAFLLTIAVTQAWRVFSEFMRADFRGAMKFTAYQWMSLGSIGIAIVMVSMVAGQVPPASNISAGLSSVWNPVVLLSLQALMVFIFLFTGRSMVTDSKLSFHICHDRI